MADLEGYTSDGDDPPPALIEDEEVYPVRTYGEQSIIALQVKRCSFDTYVGQGQWAFVELELVSSHLEWGPTLERSVRDGTLWVVSAAQERRNSRQLLHGETMSRNLTLGPYEQHFSRRSVYIVALPVYWVLLVYIYQQPRWRRYDCLRTTLTYSISDDYY